jgi:hypothetical protein
VMMSIFAITLSTTYYLPVYFQAIQNKSPMMSGVYILPSILSQLAVAVTSGALSEYIVDLSGAWLCEDTNKNLVGKMGYYLPWAVASGILTSIGGGLLSTLTPYTETGKWVGYQILAGAGRGAGFQTVRIFLSTNFVHLLTFDSLHSLSSRSKTPFHPAKYQSPCRS